LMVNAERIAVDTRRYRPDDYRQCKTNGALDFLDGDFKRRVKLSLRWWCDTNFAREDTKGIASHRKLCSLRADAIRCQVFPDAVDVPPFLDRCLDGKGDCIAS